MRKKELGIELDLSRPTINAYVAGLEQEIIKGRYPQYAIAGKRINFYALLDYMTYKDVLEDEKLRKELPDFDPIAVARICGKERHEDY